MKTPDNKQSSEHAVRAADKLYDVGFTHAHPSDYAYIIQRHAVAPAVADVEARNNDALASVNTQFAEIIAERDKRIAELEEALACAEREKRLEAGLWLRIQPDKTFGGAALLADTADACEKLADEWKTLLAKKGQP